MELYLSLQNKKLIELQQDFNEEAWNDFHNANINTQDDFYDYFHTFIDNAVIYTSDCELILAGNSEYNYDSHDVFGRPNSIEQAAYSCLYDYIMHHDDTVTWEEMEHVLNEANDHAADEAEMTIDPKL